MNRQRRFTWIVIYVCLILVAIFSAPNANADGFIKDHVKLWGSAATIAGDQDELYLGFSLEWKYVAFDFAHGRKRVQWWAIGEEDWEADEWQSGSAFSTRIYPFGEGNIRPLFIWHHSSDVTRGQPFNGTDEPTADFAGIGATFVWKRLELDAAFGRQYRECAIFTCGDNAASNEVFVRVRGVFFGAK